MAKKISNFNAVAINSLTMGILLKRKNTEVARIRLSPNGDFSTNSRLCTAVIEAYDSYLKSCKDSE